MERNVQAYLYDIVTACRHILSFTAKMTLEAYRSDIRTKAACERMFEIIGESLRRLRTDFPDVFAQIPDAMEMIAFRNIIAHGYDIIDDELVWSSITSEVPPLTHLCQQLLNDRQHPRPEVFALDVMPLAVVPATAFEVAPAEFGRVVRH